MENKNIFWIFGGLQAATLGLIVYFALGGAGIGQDTRAWLSALFPISLLVVEYLLYTK